MRLSDDERPIILKILIILPFVKGLHVCVAYLFVFALHASPLLVLTQVLVSFFDYLGLC